MWGMENQFNVVEGYGLFMAGLRHQIEDASEYALRVCRPTFRPTNYDYEKKRKLNSQRRLRDNDILTFKFRPVNEHQFVFINDAHRYPLLLNLALRQILKSVYGCSEENLNSKLSDQHAQWFRENINHHLEHELGHYFGALEHTLLRARLGVEFYVQPDRTLSFRPHTDLQGRVEVAVFREFVLCGPKTLSDGDKLVQEAVTGNG